MTEGHDLIRERAIRLFTFLKELSELRTKTIRTVDAYENVLWLTNIPREHGCYCAMWGIDSDQEQTDTWIKVCKPRISPPPKPPKELEPWLDSKQIADSSLDLPELRARIVVSTGPGA